MCFTSMNEYQVLWIILIIPICNDDRTSKFYAILEYIWGFLIGSAHLYVHRKYWQEILFPSLNYACKWRINLFHEVLSSLQMGIIRIIQRTWYSFIDVKHIRTRTINQLRDGNSISCQYFRCTYKWAEPIKNPQIYSKMA
jgi:hypothetical protein